MDAAFTAEQDEIRRTLRELLDGGGEGDELWHRLARDLRLPGLGIPQEYGGAGRGTAELAVVLEETGRALLPSPLLATAVLAAPLILALGTEEQRAALLPAVAAGDLTAALAVPGGSLSTALGLAGDPTGGSWAGGGRAGGVQARPAGGGSGGWRLYGEADRVPDGDLAGLLLVAAHAGGFPRSRTLLFLVRADGPRPPAGLARTRRTSPDPTRPLARVQLRDTEAVLLGADDTVDAGPALAAAGRTAAAALAAEAVGAAAGALERAAAYVAARERSGGSFPASHAFQAEKHRIAELYVRVRSARSAAYFAAWDAETAGLALAQALEALRAATAEAVRLPGDAGPPDREHEAHPYAGRAAVGQLLLGPAHRLRDHAARRSGLFATADDGGAGHGPAGDGSAGHGAPGSGSAGHGAPGSGGAGHGAAGQVAV
ncbi:acyl-CoA dehydrogenase [Streptomyces sp. A0958]|uniref:acyl-CoA dehydrogenase family protein n=1 Tax=Streptomyces sp. A0958 TaxID=2563101 RepID=UPI00109E8E0A|nr:acyl-CoA dehydrogenase family protein [Streptomyces sp. A0958]THA72787.1 acyl-CoA dehydrogenase [Streptomyces sp. A0958]